MNEGDHSADPPQSGLFWNVFFSFWFKMSLFFFFLLSSSYASSSPLKRSPFQLDRAGAAGAGGVPARPGRHRSLVTLRCLLPFPLEEAAAPGAQRRRTVSPMHISPASPHSLTCNSSARPAPGPAGPAREVGSSSRVDGPPAPGQTPAAERCGSWSCCPRATSGYSPLRAPRQGWHPLEAQLGQEQEEPNGEAVKQGSRYSAPSWPGGQ